MPDSNDAHNVFFRLLDSINSYDQALRAKDLDPAAKEAAIQAIDECLGDSNPKLESHHIPSADESQRLRFREMGAVLREAEEAIKPLARYLM